MARKLGVWNYYYWIFVLRKQGEASNTRVKEDIAFISEYINICLQHGLLPSSIFAVYMPFH